MILLGKIKEIVGKLTRMLLIKKYIILFEIVEYRNSLFIKRESFYGGQNNVRREITIFKIRKRNDKKVIIKSI